MHWLAATPDGFDLHTDHNNLIFFFDSLSVLPDLSQKSLRKDLLWAVRLSMYTYTCFLINGDDKVWADLLTRWSTPLVTVRRLVSVPELPSFSLDYFEWPTLDGIVACRQRPCSLGRRPRLCPTISGVFRTVRFGNQTRVSICSSACLSSPTVVRLVIMAVVQRSRP